MAPQPIGQTDAQRVDMASIMDDKTSQPMEDTGDRAYGDAGRMLDQIGFNDDIERQIALSASERNASLDAKIQASMGAPQFTFAPQIDQVTAAQFAARDGLTLDPMADQMSGVKRYYPPTSFPR